MFVRKQILIVLALVLLVVAVTFLVLGFKAQQRVTTPSSGNQIKTIVKKDYPADLQGKVYMTLRNKTTGVNGIYYFDLALGKLEQSYLPKNCFAVGGEINSLGTEMVVSSNCGSEKVSTYQIYSTNTDKETQAITKSPTDFKKEAVWSPDNKKVAFMVASPDERDNPNPAFKINTWNIFTSDLEGNEQFVGSAVHPFFSPDGKKILALRREGLYLFDLETGKGERVHIFDTVVSVSTQLDLSDQKDRLAVANSTDQTIAIFKIKSWDNFELEEMTKIGARSSYVSWPKFAPDNQKYLITEELFDDQSIKLVVYNLETKEKKAIADLSSYKHNALWINDWR